MHHWQCASTLFRPLLLSTIISNLFWSGFSVAEDRKLTYSSAITDPSSIALSDAIKGDGNYNATVNVDNPNGSLEVYIGQTETNDKTYDVGDYSVNIQGQNNTAASPYTAFFGLAADRNNTVSLNNFSFNNNLMVGDGHHHNSTALIASNGSKVTINGKVYINSLVEMETSGASSATAANNGLYATGAGSTITANSGDVYINTYGKNFFEVLTQNGTYPSGSSKSDAVSGKHGGQVTINQTGNYQVNLLGNLDLGDDFVNRGSITALLNGANSYWHGTEINTYDAGNNIWAGNLDVTLMNKAQWIPDAVNAEISALNLQKEGVVNLHGLNLHTQKSQNESVKIYDLKGSEGIFLIDVNTSKTDDQRKNGSDFIEVVSSATGGMRH